MTFLANLAADPKALIARMRVGIAAPVALRRAVAALKMDQGGDRVEDDPDIAELVRASGRAASRDKWKFWSALAVISVLAVSLLAYGWFRERQVSAALKDNPGNSKRASKPPNLQPRRQKATASSFRKKPSWR